MTKFLTEPAFFLKITWFAVLLAPEARVFRQCLHPTIRNPKVHVLPILARAFTVRFEL